MIVSAAEEHDPGPRADAADPSHRPGHVAGSGTRRSGGARPAMCAGTRRGDSASARPRRSRRRPPAGKSSTGVTSGGFGMNPELSVDDVHELRERSHPVPLACLLHHRIQSSDRHVVRTSPISFRANPSARALRVETVVPGVQDRGSRPRAASPSGSPRPTRGRTHAPRPRRNHDGGRPRRSSSPGASRPIRTGRGTSRRSRSCRR